MNTFNSLFGKRIHVFVLLIGLLAFGACSGGDEGVTPDENSAPVVVFAVDALAFPKDSDATLAVVATDPDGDDVSVQWQVTRNGEPSGTLDPAQQGSPSITWVTPSTTGRDTITITATDGKGGTTTRVETILVGTRKNTAIQTQNVTWNASDSPFIIQSAGGKFVIDLNGSLTVQAGCELLIDQADLEIDVLGTFRTNGATPAPVIIRPNSRKPGVGWWTGIVAAPDGPAPLVRLNHTDILYAKEAIFAVSPSEVRLNGCRIMFCSEAAVLFHSSQDLEILNSAITNNVKSGIRIGGPAVSTLPDSVVIRGDSLSVNGDISGETPYTDQAAIYIDIPDYSRHSSITIQETEISRNGFPAIQLVRASYPLIHDNSIFSNQLGKDGQRYNVWLNNEFGDGGAQDTISAELNYWGVTDSVEIGKMIRDSDDSDRVKARLLFSPWLHTAP